MLYICLHAFFPCNCSSDNRLNSTPKTQARSYETATIMRNTERAALAGSQSAFQPPAFVWMTADGSGAQSGGLVTKVSYTEVAKIFIWIGKPK